MNVTVEQVTRNIRVESVAHDIIVRKPVTNIQVNQVGRRGIQGEKGDQGDPATNLVQSVNGKQGVVVIDLDDLGVTASTTELNRVEGITSNIQEQLDSKADTSSLGTAAAEDVEYFATAAQGALADTAIQTETDPTVPSWAKQSTKPSYTKSEVGLGNVDNTSDLNKPISTATQSALNDKLSAITGNVWNEAGNATNFRFEGDTYENLFNIKGETDRIGIGTGTPQTILHIASSSGGADALNIQMGAYTALGSQWSSAGTILGNNVRTKQTATAELETITTHGSFGGRAIDMHSSRGITFHALSGAVTAGATFNSERMRLHNTGQLSIGSTNIFANLYVRGATAATVDDGINTPTFAHGNASDSYGFKMGLLGNGSTWMQGARLDGSATKYQIMLNPQGGNVSINTPSTTSYALLVNGTAHFTDNVSTNGGGPNGTGTKTLIGAPYVQSRGQNLVTNGFGTLQNNYNFSQMVYDGTELFAGNGSFSKIGTTTILSDELIPVDPNQTYEQIGYVKETTGTAGTRFYLGIAPQDADGFTITAGHHMRQVGTDTYLAEDLKPGDTVVKLVSAANWANAAGSATYFRTLLIFGYQSLSGYTYPDYTYSRRNINNAYDDGAVNYTNNTITLRSPFPSVWGTIPSGTAISNGSSGSTYKYVAATGEYATSNWTRWVGKIAGLDYSGENKVGMFPAGTSNIKLLILANYQSGVTTGKQNFSALSFGVVPHQAKVYRTTSATAINPNMDTANIFIFSNQSSYLGIGAPYGKMQDGDEAEFWIRGSSSLVGIGWNAVFNPRYATLPTTTTVDKWTRVRAVFNATQNLWDVTDVQVEGNPYAKTSDLATKANFPLTNSHIPFRDGSGVQSSLGATASPTAGTVVIRDASGRFSAVDPTSDTQVTTKKYVDDKVTGATDTFTSQDGKTVTVANGLITSIV